MIQQKTAFLRILKVEMDDLEKDIELLIQEYTQKHDNDQMTNYVFNENLALLQRELFGLKGFREEIAAMEPGEEKSLEELREHLDNRLKERVLEKGLPNAILLLMERKIGKVVDYITPS